ncbi:MAG TPA: hypothetical protein VK669_00495 [Candidatus Limnocylindrales bacterium]|nr:hypothetical protein [Candidatus Limnocylindrales bacterium]
MPGRRTFTVLSLAFAFAALPLGSRAQSASDAGDLRLNFVPPKGWTDSTRPSERPGLWKSWVIVDRGTVHSLVLSVTREKTPAAAFGASNAAGIAAIPGTSNVSSGPTSVCGDVPAFQVTYRSDRTAGHPMIIKHYFVDVGPLVGDISYAHPPETAERADALDAMSTLCEQRVYAMHAPAGWRGGGIRSSDHPGVDAFTSPAGDQTLLALAVSAGISMAAKALAPTVVTGGGASIISDAEETCGTIHVRHARWRTNAPTSAGTPANVPQLVEQIAGYRHGVSYLYTYTRPENATADPEAQRALTSFCAPGATLATPPPQAQPTAAPSMTPA